jgi:hypothetical protein
MFIDFHIRKNMMVAFIQKYRRPFREGGGYELSS